MRVGPDAFDRMVKRAIGRIPEEIRACLDNVLITVQGRASAELLEEMGLPPDENLPRGLRWRPRCPERSIEEPPLYPDTIILFQESIEAMCETREEMEREIEITGGP